MTQFTKISFFKFSTHHDGKLTSGLLLLPRTADATDVDAVLSPPKLKPPLDVTLVFISFGAGTVASDPKPPPIPPNPLV